MLQKISIIEDGELKNIMDCREETIRDWLWWKRDFYPIELVIMLLKELKNEKDKKETNH